MKLKLLEVITVSTAFFGITVAIPAQASLLGPLGGTGLNGEYASFLDSPFNGKNFDYFFLEDFEDLLLNTPGVTTSAGNPALPSVFTDSVDLDDGIQDGSGTAGNSFFSAIASTGITFIFDDVALGAFPDSVGIVWTDGAGTTSFEAFSPDGVSLGNVGPVSIADGFFTGATLDDRFFGVEDLGPIGSIFISNTIGGIEIDHLQYGLKETIPEPPQTTPGPTTILGLLFFSILGLSSRRGSKILASGKQF